MTKIAIPISSENNIDNHFGHCDYFGVYTISEQNKITDYYAIKSEKGCGCKSNIASVLARQGVSIMLAGGIGNGAIKVLGNNGIKVIRGCSGEPKTILEKFIKGEILDSGISCNDNNSTHKCNH